MVCSGAIAGAFDGGVTLDGLIVFFEGLPHMQRDVLQVRGIGNRFEKERGGEC